MSKSSSANMWQQMMHPFKTYQSASQPVSSKASTSSSISKANQTLNQQDLKAVDANFNHVFNSIFKNMSIGTSTNTATSNANQRFNSLMSQQSSASASMAKRLQSMNSLAQSMHNTVLKQQMQANQTVPPLKHPKPEAYHRIGAMVNKLEMNSLQQDTHVASQNVTQLLPALVDNDETNMLSPLYQQLCDKDNIDRLLELHQRIPMIWNQQLLANYSYLAAELVNQSDDTDKRKGIMILNIVNLAEYQWNQMQLANDNPYTKLRNTAIKEHKMFLHVWRNMRI